MEHNVCGADRKLRLAAGAALIAVALHGGSDSDRDAVSLTRVLAGYGAAEFLLINGVLQWCPLNYAVGFDSCERDWPDVVRDRLGRSDSEGVSEKVPAIEAE